MVARAQDHFCRTQEASRIHGMCPSPKQQSLTHYNFRTLWYLLNIYIIFMSLVTNITIAECALYSLLPTIMPISPAEATKEYSLPIIHFVTGPGGRAAQYAVLIIAQI